MFFSELIIDRGQIVFLADGLPATAADIFKGNFYVVCPT